MGIMSKHLHNFKKNQFFAYVGGFIDGDGSIMILKDKKKKYYYPQVDITAKNDNQIKLLHERFIGGYYRIKDKYSNVYWRENNAVSMLMKIKKFLVLKRSQADCAIKLQLSKNKKGCNKRNLENDKIKELLYDEIYQLNHRKQLTTLGIKMSNGDFYAYLAGIIDSEGCIFIAKTKRGFGCSSLKISTTDKALQLFIKQRMGFGSYRDRKNRIEYIIEWKGKNFLRIIRKIKKFLILKKDQADLAEKFQQRKTNKGGNKLSENEIQIRKSIYEEIKNMKRAA